MMNREGNSNQFWLVCDHFMWKFGRRCGTWHPMFGMLWIYVTILAAGCWWNFGMIWMITPKFPQFRCLLAHAAQLTFTGKSGCDLIYNLNSWTELDSWCNSGMWTGLDLLISGLCWHVSVWGSGLHPICHVGGVVMCNGDRVLRLPVGSGVIMWLSCGRMDNSRPSI